MTESGNKCEAISARRKRRAKLRVQVLSLVGPGPVMVALPTVFVLVVGLLPALTWYIVDPAPGRFAFKCISRFNIAGLVAFLHQLWTRGNDMAAAIDIVTDPFAWMSFMGAASAGWLVYHAVRAVVTVAHDLYAKHQTEAMLSLQQEPEREWGAAVAGEDASPTRSAPGNAETMSPMEEEGAPG